MTGTELVLTPQLFAIFASIVEEACGVYYGPQDRGIFESKLAVQAAEAGYDTLLDYYYRLRYDDPRGEEMRKLVEALVVHETYFFRELPPLVELVDGHLAKVIHKRGSARVWSAACATGEEPLTMAMLLAERGLLERTEVVGTDVSTAAIARATSQRHAKRSLRDGHPRDLAARYLDVTERGVVVAPRIHAAVRFSTINLLEDDAVRALGAFDVVLCRNVLIYFRDEQLVRVIERVGRALAPDGLLAVGVSESLLRFGTSLSCEEHAGSFFYRSAR